MKNDAYWAGRLKKTEDALKDKSYTYVQDLDRDYDAAIRDIDQEIRAWYQRFAGANGVDITAARKMLTGDELEEFRWTVEEYIRHGEEHAITGAWARELESASARVHVSRLESLKLRLREHAEELGSKAARVTKSAAELNYTESYYHTAFEVQKGLGVGWTMQGIDESRLEKVLSRPWAADGADFSSRIWAEKEKLVETLGQSLTRMIAMGKGPDQAIKEITGRFKTARANAGRVIMTESAYFGTLAQHDCFTDLGVEEYAVVAALDEATCEICGALDGKVFKMSEFVPGATAPPFHPWCRCCTAPHFADMKDAGARFARDPKTGKGYTVPRDMTYEEWRGQQDASRMSMDGTVLSRQELTYHTAEEYAEIVRYAEERGIRIFQVEQFDGDTSILYDQIDALYEVRQEYGLTKKLTIGFADLSPGDLAVTSREGSSIVFDRNVLRNRAATNAYLSANNRLAINDLKGIAYHEAGHLIAKRYGENGIDIAMQAYYNIFGEQISVPSIKKYLFKAVSTYSIRVDELRREPYRNKDYKEVIPEIFSKHKTEEDAFCSEFVRLFKEVHGI